MHGEPYSEFVTHKPCETNACAVHINVLDAHLVAVMLRVEEGVWGAVFWGLLGAHAVVALTHRDPESTSIVLSIRPLIFQPKPNWGLQKKEHTLVSRDVGSWC